jgi:hypothetical protein
MSNYLQKNGNNNFNLKKFICDLCKANGLNPVVIEALLGLLDESPATRMTLEQAKNKLEGALPKGSASSSSSP